MPGTTLSQPLQYSLGCLLQVKANGPNALNKGAPLRLAYWKEWSRREQQRLCPRAGLLQKEMLSSFDLLNCEVGIAAVNKSKKYVVDVTTVLL
jgi:hypothetical protein